MNALQGYIQRVAAKRASGKVPKPVRKSISKSKRGMKPAKKGC